MFADISEALDFLKSKDPHQTEFLQAAEEILSTLAPLLKDHPKYYKVLHRFLEPERVIQFRVPWHDKNGNEQVNRGFRVQFNSAIGPYKGGLRFSPSVNLSILKFLGLEQTLKNALTTLPLGGGKGGSDFDPKGKTDDEVMRFCQSFMTELMRHIGPSTDVPAGDQGTGSREIGYLYGQYKRITNSFTGVLTGKAPEYGGSLLRPEATGYGAVYFLKHMLKANGKELEGQKVLVSGSGNVAQYAVSQLMKEKAIVLTMSDSSGVLFFEDGMSESDWESICELKNGKRGRLSEFKGKKGTYSKGKTPWSIQKKADIAFPCATQNEISSSDASSLVKSGVFCVNEGANMPSTKESVEIYAKNGFLYGPAKAVNAGGVGVSGLEMSQNAGKTQWEEKTVQKRLEEMMENIFESVKKYAKLYGKDEKDYAAGANIAGFVKVADAMLAQGSV